MGLFQATRKCVVIFLILFVFNSFLLTHGRQIKPLSKGTVVVEDTPLSPLKARTNVPTTSSEKKKVDPSMIPKQGVESFVDSNTDTNGFRPTTPGNSPGVGHRKFAQEGEDMKAMVAVQSPDVKVYETEGTTNGFKPTDPGHSPGVGHSQQNKIGQ
ncbi:hypothetical protein VNO78_26692 [Psophocarpus tetragonolobus]|uniref:Encoded peptide n=1 Tax=Psophocarpus tetragonolobus TaxID=3891 RepID=A0AAN9S2A9_PSOTE